MYSHKHTFKNLLRKLLDLNNADGYGCRDPQIVTEGVPEKTGLNKYVNNYNDPTYNLQ